ncbi:hypothetical protein PTRA_a3522 [Pseudoalteromonas translucida KMM 520]|uniref:Uncharacterized protein n=1 Tax=Pseudoalteromonas translucida KMM 520 TaxID=1315283 RepID=A0A0U2NJY0_9GAMM|nr:hypothetical protein PTRA_a3522 [Pseudoalteromonas translucida KMM 520]
MYPLLVDSDYQLDLSVCQHPNANSSYLFCRACFELLALKWVLLFSAKTHMLVK